MAVHPAHFLARESIIRVNYVRNYPAKSVQIYVGVKTFYLVSDKLWPLIEV